MAACINCEQLRISVASLQTENEVLKTQKLQLENDIQALRGRPRKKSRQDCEAENIKKLQDVLLNKDEWGFVEPSLVRVSLLPKQYDTVSESGSAHSVESTIREYTNFTEYYLQAKKFNDIRKIILCLLCMSLDIDKAREEDSMAHEEIRKVSEPSISSSQINYLLSFSQWCLRVVHVIENHSRWKGFSTIFLVEVFKTASFPTVSRLNNNWRDTYEELIQTKLLSGKPASPLFPVCSIIDVIRFISPNTWEKILPSIETRRSSCRPSEHEAVMSIGQSLVLCPTVLNLETYSPNVQIRTKYSAFQGSSRTYSTSINPATKSFASIQHSISQSALMVAQSTQAQHFSMLIHNLSPLAVSEVLIRNGTRPQTRWSNSGELYTITADDSLREDIARLFRDEANLRNVIQYCIANGMIKRQEADSSRFTYATSDQWRILHDSVPDPSGYWLHQALSYLAFICPRCPPTAGVSARAQTSLSPSLHSVWKRAQKEGAGNIPPRDRDALLGAFLSSSGSTDRVCTTEGLHELNQLVTSSTPECLRLLLLLQQSVALRSIGLHEQSERQIEDHKDSHQPDSQSSYAWYLRGRLQLSRAENAIQREELHEAAEYVNKCGEAVQALTESSSAGDMLIHLSRMQATAYGRIWRYRGEFQMSRNCLETALAAPEMTLPVNVSQKQHILHHLAEVCCELEDLSTALHLVQPDFERLENDGRVHVKAFRRFALVLVEVHIRSRDLTAARALLSRLAVIFKKISSPDPADQVGHVRVKVNHAFVEYLDGSGDLTAAVRSLQEAYEMTQSYKTFSQGSFYSHIVLQFSFLIKNRLGDASAAKQLRQIPAAQVQHFMAGIGTAFRLFLQEEVKKAVSKLP